MGLRQLMSGSLGRHKSKKNKKVSSTIVSPPPSTFGVKKLNNSEKCQKEFTTQKINNHTYVNITPRDELSTNRMVGRHNDYAYIKPLFEDLPEVSDCQTNMKRHFIVNFRESSTPGLVQRRGENYVDIL